MKSPKEIWDRLDQLLEEKVPGLFGNLAAPATFEQIKALETATGAELPEDVRYAYSRHNGSLDISRRGIIPGFFVTCFSRSFDWLSTEDCLLMWEDKLEIERIYGDERREMMDQGPLLEGKIIIGDCWYPEWIPIGQNGRETIVVDLKPGKTGRRGQIFHHNGVDDANDESMLSGGLNTYLQQFFEFLYSGNLYFDNQLGGWVDVDRKWRKLDRNA